MKLISLLPMVVLWTNLIIFFAVGKVSVGDKAAPLRYFAFVMVLLNAAGIAMLA